MSTEDGEKKPVRILALDDAGPGAYSQLLILNEYMNRVALDMNKDTSDVYPADYFDLIGGVGFGGFISLLLGHLRMSVDEAIDTLVNIGNDVFPVASQGTLNRRTGVYEIIKALPSVALNLFFSDTPEKGGPDSNTKVLKEALERLLQNLHLPVDIKMIDERHSDPGCKVALYAAARANLTHVTAFRTYRSQDRGLNPTIVDAIRASVAVPPFFSPVSIGEHLTKQKFVSGAFIITNPTRELLEEARRVFEKDTHMFQIFNIGSGLRRVHSLDVSEPTSDISRSPELENELIASDMSTRADKYLRLDVNRGMEDITMDQWNKLGLIHSHTDAYLGTADVKAKMDSFWRRLHETNQDVVIKKIALDFSLSIKDGKDILGTLEIVHKALNQVLKYVKAFSQESSQDWSVPIKKLSLQLDTMRNQRTKLGEDVEINFAAPPLEQFIADPLQKYFSIMTRFTNGDNNVEAIKQKTTELETSFEAYSIELHRSVAKLVSDTEGRSFKSLVPVKNSMPKSVDPESNAYGKQHKQCFKGTRLKTLSAIRQWVDDKDTSKRIFCLLDFAGSGKSTVAKTIAEEWGKRRLFARFFFSRDTAKTSSTNSFCLTVANGFAGLNPEFKKHIKRFRKRPDLDLLSFEEQFEGLIAAPLRALSQDSILMIDALDECDNEHKRREELLEILSRQQSSLPHLRILVTGRPEHSISKWARSTAAVRLTNFKQLEGNDEDVETYIRARLQDLPHHMQDRISLVIHGAEGVFIWARIACDLVLSAVNKDALLGKLKGHVRLDDLYRIALEQSMPQDGVSEQETAMILQMILSVRTPLSIVELDKLAPKPGVVEEVVTRLGSLLLYDSPEDPIRLLHTTFREFLIVGQNINATFIQPTIGHYSLALGCIQLLSHHSGQQESALAELDGVSERAFKYSSKSWAYHCRMSPRKLGLNERILEFASNRLRPWMILVDKSYGISLEICAEDVLSLARCVISPQGTEMLLHRSLEMMNVSTKYRHDGSFCLYLHIQQERMMEVSVKFQDVRLKINGAVFSQLEGIRIQHYQNLSTKLKKKAKNRKDPRYDLPLDWKPYFKPPNKSRRFLHEFHEPLCERMSEDNLKDLKTKFGTLQETLVNKGFGDKS